MGDSSVYSKPQGHILYRTGDGAHFYGNHEGTMHLKIFSNISYTCNLSGIIHQLQFLQSGTFTQLNCVSDVNEGLPFIHILSSI